MTFIPYEKRKCGPLGPNSKEIIKKTDKYSSNHYARYPFAPIYSNEHGYMMLMEIKH